MKTFILPGFSLHNRDWAEQMERELPKELGCTVINWPHWETGNSQDFSAVSEADKFLVRIQTEEEVNILAKSVGTLVTAVTLSKQGETERKMINKIILCGLPVSGMDEESRSFYSVLSNMPSGDLLVVQNLQDPYGSYGEVKSLLGKVNPAVEILGKELDTHEYYYTEDFNKFFLG